MPTTETISSTFLLAAIGAISGAVYLLDYVLAPRSIYRTNNASTSKVTVEWSESKDSKHGQGIAVVTVKAKTEDLAVTPDDVGPIVASLKPQLLRQYQSKGVVLLRGLPFQNPRHAEQVFHFLVDHRLHGAGPIGWLPNWILQRLSDGIYSALMARADRKRKATGSRAKGGIRSLAPATNDVQGPHQENQFLQYRAPHVSFYVQHPPIKYGETALYNAVQAYTKLPTKLQEKLNHLEYLYLLQMDDGGKLREQYPTAYKVLGFVFTLFLNNIRTWVPMVLTSPVSGERALQFFGFGERINEVTAKEFNRCYPGRDASPCPDYYGHYYLKPKSSTNRTIEAYEGQCFNAEEERAILAAYMESSTLVSWQKDDICLVDNVRWAHGRVNGVNGDPRKLHFFQAGPVVDVYSMDGRQRQ